MPIRPMSRWKPIFQPKLAPSSVPCAGSKYEQTAGEFTALSSSGTSHSGPPIDWPE
jgi:hypothetical protein